MQIVAGTQLKAFIKVLGSNYEILKLQRKRGWRGWNYKPSQMIIFSKRVKHQYCIFVFLSEQYQKTVLTLAISHQTTKFTNINSDSYKGKHKGTKNRTSARHQYTKFLKCKKTSSLTYPVSSYVKMQTNHLSIRTFNQAFHQTG